MMSILEKCFCMLSLVLEPLDVSQMLKTSSQHFSKSVSEIQGYVLLTNKFAFVTFLKMVSVCCMFGKYKYLMLNWKYLFLENTKK